MIRIKTLCATLVLSCFASTATFANEFADDQARRDEQLEEVERVLAQISSHQFTVLDSINAGGLSPADLQGMRRDLQNALAELARVNSELEAMRREIAEQRPSS